MQDINIVSPLEILDARERRAKRQSQMRDLGADAVISFTLNIAGPVKQNEKIKKCFNEGVRLIKSQLKRRRIKIIRQKEWIEKTGCEAMFAVSDEAERIKMIMISVEEESNLGRLFDIDVISKEGCIISRKMLGIPERKCMICNNPAHECIRGQKHELSLIENKVNLIIDEHLFSERAEVISAIICRSLLYELFVTPKPGLVDLNNSGSHRDMDIYTFANSISVLTPYFKTLYMHGYRFKNQEPENILEKLSFIGIEAEEKMLEVTGQVNTHKGSIFSLGLLCAALGWSEGNGRSIEASMLLPLCGEIALASIKNDLGSINPQNAMTTGEKFFLETGNAGARSEAASGYPSVLLYGLPVFKRFISEGLSLNDAGVYTLLHLILHSTDTNIIARSSYAELGFIKEKVRAFLDGKTLPSIESVKNLDDYFIKNNISPGGCADLLAMIYALYFLEKP